VPAGVTEQLEAEVAKAAAARKKLAQPFESLRGVLAEEIASETERERIVLNERLQVIDDFGDAFPKRIDEASAAELMAIEAHNDALAKIRAEGEEPLRSGIDELSRSLLTETEAINAAYSDRVNRILQYGELEGVAEEEVTALLVRVREDRLRQLGELDEQRAADQAQRNERQLTAAVDVTSSLLGLLESEVGQQIQINDQMSAEEQRRAEETNRRNKEKFEKNKQYQAGQAVISSLAGAALALADPALGTFERFAAVATSLATGAGIVSKIRAAEFGGGSVTGVSTSGGASSGSAGTSLSSSNSSAAADVGERQTNVTNNYFNVSGDSQLVNETRFREMSAAASARNSEDRVTYADPDDITVTRANVA